MGKAFIQPFALASMQRHSETSTLIRGCINVVALHRRLYRGSYNSGHLI